MSARYVPALDGLRGFAIIIVMIYHALWTPITGGFLGVDLFFVLSGYLITSGLISEYRQHNKINFKNFYMRRVLRLLPALVVLLLSTLLYIWFTTPEQFVATLKEAGVAFFYMSNWARAYHLYPLAWFGHTWSLSIEEQFYFLWPILFLGMMNWLKKESKVLGAFILILLSLFLERIYLTYTYFNIHRLYNAFDTRAEALLLGCFLAYFLSHRTIGSKGKKILATFSFLSLMILFLLFFSLHWKEKGTYLYGLSLAGLCSSILIMELIMGEGKFLSYIFHWKIVRYLGKISYGLYLWHFVIYHALKRWDFTNQEILFYGGSLSIIISSLSYNLIERPILSFKKNFA